MGYILNFKCNRKEDHEDVFHIGVGMMFPKRYKSIIKQIKKGKYGEEIKSFLEKNPKGAINCDIEIAQCPKCRKIEEVINLSMYVPKKNYNPNKRELSRWTVGQSFKKTTYVSPYELKTKYKKIKEYKHICSECSNTMKIIKIKHDDCGDIIEDKSGNFITNIKIKCPICNGSMKISKGGFWD